MKSAQAFRTRVVALAAAVAAVLARPALAETRPQPVPFAPPRPAPEDVAFPGVIQLEVDARDVAHRYFQVRERIPAPRAGPMTLLYPQWNPGENAPTGPIEQLAGLLITADGVRLNWVRDTVDMYAFHIDVPAGAKTLELQYQFLGSTGADTPGRAVMTPTMLALEWNLVVLYPSGHFVRDITYRPSVRLPAGWSFASALDGAVRTGDRVEFAPVDLQALVDSPVMAGLHFRRVSLAESPGPVWLDMVADTPDDLKVPPEAIARYRQLVIQADKLFGTRHFDHYDFLAFLSNDFVDYLEHHRSSEQSVPADFFTNWAKNGRAHPGLAHGFVHAWNGKFRRPAQMWTADFNTPQRDGLLWIQEGLTMYWQTVLAARSGLSSHQDVMNALASLSAEFQDRAGARWRPLQDTTNDEIIQRRRPISWSNWQRDVFDSFLQGELIWLDADTLIRERTGGERSLDDFARAFFGVNDGGCTTVTYTFEDVVEALNAVAPYDWAGFFRARLDSYDTAHALDGVTRGGYRLVFDDQPSPAQQASEAESGVADLSYSLALIIGKTGEIQDAIWGGPGFEAGLASGDVIEAVNGQPYSSQGIKAAVQAAARGAPLSLQVKTPTGERTIPVAWRGGLRYPHLQAIPGAKARLDAILAPKA